MFGFPTTVPVPIVHFGARTTPGHDWRAAGAGRRALASAPRTPQGMGYRLFSRFRIGTRLAAMMVLAATVQRPAGGHGYPGTGGRQRKPAHGVRRAHDPVRSLAQIAHLMLSNQLQRKGRWRHPRPTQTAHARPAAGGSPPRRASHRAQHAHHRPAVGSVCRHTQRSKEAALAERFARQRAVYLQEAVKPTMDALRMLDYADTQRLADTAHNLYERASLDIRALTDLQFQLAHATYEAGVRSHAQTRQWALGALLASMALLSFLVPC